LDAFANESPTADGTTSETTMSMTSPPTDLPRRSFVHRKLVAHGARFVEINDGLVALRYGELDESAAAARLGLADLSVLPRTGFKGRKVIPALEAQGVELTVPNQAIRQADGGIAAVLAMTEVLLLAPLGGDASQIRMLERGWSLDQAEGCYLAPRQDSHFWFALTGEHASATLAKLCGVDLRLNRFADLGVAQTSVAHSNCAVIRGDIGTLPAFHLLGDSASASYVWDCLLDAMAEFDGRPVGLAALQRAQGSTVASSHS
jgi:sarcosine oxidase subunit gamma